MYNESTRIRGGSCFGDSVFRCQASSFNYARTMFNRVAQKEWGEVSPYTLHMTEKFFIIAHKGSPLIIKDYDFVEEKRSIAVHAYEDWVLDIIRRKAGDEDES